jgi:trans-2,3-dihydro-3-hydroxyanthranilate isomerase
MTRLPVRLYAAFSARPFGGNIAGVVYDNVGLPSETMQKIASDLGAPTTGFVSNSDAVSCVARFFSPSCEMDLCGHVTVGIFSALWDDKRLAGFDQSGCFNFTQKTKAGDLSIEVSGEPGQRPRISMRQNDPTFEHIAVQPADVAPLLSVAEHRIIAPLGVVSTAVIPLT